MAVSLNRTLEIDLAGIRTPVTVWGEGPPVLLVPGGGARCDGYFPRMGEVAESSSVIVHERPGVEAGSPALSLAAQASELRRVIDAVGRGPALVVAHSLGGPVTVQLAADHPEVVAAVLLLDPTPFVDAKAVRPLGASMALVGLVERTPGLRGLLERGLMRAATKNVPEPIDPDVQTAIDVIVEPEMARRAGRRLRQFASGSRALTERLEARPLNVRGVIATGDRTPSHRFRRAHERISQLLGTDLEVWEGTTHQMHYERPERVVSTVRRLLAST